METKNIIAMILVGLAGIGGTTFYFNTADYTSVDFNKAVYQCNSTMAIMNCDHLSSTKATCYPNTNSTGSKVCSKGKWNLLDIFINKQLPNKINI